MLLSVRDLGGFTPVEAFSWCLMRGRAFQSTNDHFYHTRDGFDDISQQRAHAYPLCKNEPRVAYPLMGVCELRMTASVWNAKEAS